MNAFPIFRFVLLALLVAACAWLFLTGEAIHAQSERAALIAAIWRHVGYGAILTPLLIGAPLTFFWSARGRPGGNAFLHIAALWAMRVVMAAVIVLAVTGPLVVWTHGSDLKVFDWFVIANPIGKREAIHAALESGHGALAEALPWISGLTAAIALFTAMANNTRSR